jgi:hypothetical protein
MIDKRELLAMLSVHGVDLLNARGGKPTITAQDIAAMMAECSPCESELLRTKYCGDSIHETWAYWFIHLMKQKWRTKKPGSIYALSKITLAEHVSDNRCGMCQGTRGWYVGSKYQGCPACVGAGVIYLSKREISSRMGFDGGLKEPWISRLSWARRELASWELRALSNMRG